MSIEIARYQFHSWARKGISTEIEDTDDLGSGSSSVMERALIDLEIKLNDAAKGKGFALIGPGDIIGINREMIIRTEPLHYITDFEPNYLAFVEFYDEDFPFRYTPASPDGNKLRPWLLLVVLEEGDFTRTNRRTPLPSIMITNKNVFPPVTESWLWAHVHSNAGIPPDELNTYERFLNSLNQTMNDDPDQLYSRLMCPKKLKENTAYTAFVIPAFETGRKAGLGQDPVSDKAQLASWSDSGANGEVPVYYEWYFRTGVNADFESLVKILEPRIMDPRLGIRDMKADQPGFVKADGSLPFPGTQPPVIGLEGALKAPSTASTVFPDPTKPDNFRTELQKIVNLPFEITGTDVSGDPIISVPLYGGKHAKKSASDIVKLDITNDNWVNDLNRDPRTRSAAGFGTKVIQKGQEKFMRKAWQQVDGIIEANRRVKNIVLYLFVGLQFTKQTFSKIAKEKVVGISKPLLKRIMGSPTTLHQQIKDSRMPAAVFSSTFRKIIRPNGSTAKKISREKRINFSGLVTGLNESKIIVAPPKTAPAGVFTTQTISDKISKSAVQPNYKAVFEKYKLPALVILVFILVLFLLIPLVAVLLLIVGALVAYVLAKSNGEDKKTSVASSIADPAKEKELIASIPQRPSFSLKLSDEKITPAPTSTGAGKDSIEGAAYRRALTDMVNRLAVESPEKVFQPLNLPNLYTKVLNGINPAVTFPFRLKGLVKYPGYVDVSVPDKIYPAMAYPDFEEPMYKGLTDISSELLLPNLHLVPPNTISLLKVNQKFIESYMVGLNHEMGRELLWREYPTDERGSYFRQFWDVNGIIRPANNKTESERKEEMKDIDPIHQWSIVSKLGTHNKREPVAGEEQLVLLIRGDLLKRYPNTLVFAQKAVSSTGPVNPAINTTFQNDDEFNKQVKFPLYKAEISPDIKFFGFDLTIEQARGNDETDGFPGDTLGWFFVIQEVPGEPRFGMDIDRSPVLSTWDNLSWKNFGTEEIDMIKKSKPPEGTPSDNGITWAQDAAGMAYILFQKPSMVAVHASDMLENLTT